MFAYLLYFTIHLPLTQALLSPLNVVKRTFFLLLYSCRQG